VFWAGGARSAFLTRGATQLVQRAGRIDLEQAGATGLDEAGASIRSVAEGKARWGGRLVASYHVRTHGVRTGARFLSDWKQSRRPEG